MGQVALGATLSLVVVFRVNLMHPFWPGRFGLVASQALIIGELRDVDIRIVRMGLGNPVAGFARNGLVLEFGHLHQNLGVAFIAGLLSRKDWGARPQFSQSVAPVPSKLAKGRRLKEGTGDQIGGHNDDREQDQPNNLGWHFKGHNLEIVAPEFEVRRLFVFLLRSLLSFVTTDTDALAPDLAAPGLAILCHFLLTR